MKDYIVFTVAGNFYAVDVEWIERIIHTQPLTVIPNAHPFIEGMMSYEKQVIRVINFRLMTHLPTCENELLDLFERAKEGYSSWVDRLDEVTSGGDLMQFSSDRRIQKFGEWLERFNTHDPQVSAVLKRLRPLHAKLDETGKSALWNRESDPKKAHAMVEQIRTEMLPDILAAIGRLIEEIGNMAAHMQKMLIFRSDHQFFAIKVDTIEDMAQIETGSVKQVDTSMFEKDFLDIAGVIELQDKLVNVIKAVSLPTKEAA